MVHALAQEIGRRGPVIDANNIVGVQSEDVVGGDLNKALEVVVWVEVGTGITRGSI